MKVSYEEAKYIGNKKKDNFFNRYFCDWEYQEKNDFTIYEICKVKLWLYIISFIPMTICELFYLMWDGGIKEFYIISREVSKNSFTGVEADGENSVYGRYIIVRDKNKNSTL